MQVHGFFGMSLGVLFLNLNTVSYFHLLYLKPFIFSCFMIMMFMNIWFIGMNIESNMKGFHIIIVTKSLKLRYILFMISEILFFWAFFYSSLSPSVEIGVNWPPIGINSLDPYSIPLLNTAILLSSGVTVTWAHDIMVNGDKKNLFIGLFLTMLLGLMFTFLQGLENLESPFYIADSVYGSTFFVATGFHGIHVIMGTIFLLVCLVKLYNYHFTNFNHLTFEMASWYWHVVVWLFLYICMYWWGS